MVPTHSYCINATPSRRPASALHATSFGLQPALLTGRYQRNHPHASIPARIAVLADFKSQKFKPFELKVRALTCIARLRVKANHYFDRTYSVTVLNLALISVGPVSFDLATPDER
jgi:hypothetical protein